MESDIRKWIDENYEYLYKRLTLVAYHLTGDMALSEDLVQDVFILALLHPEKLIDHPQREGWLMVALHNMIKNEERRMRQGELSLTEVKEPFTADEIRGVSEILPKGLSEQERNVLIWYYEEELDYREIANRMGISEGACRLRVFRAKKHCAVLLKQQEAGNKRENGT